MNTTFQGSEVLNRFEKNLVEEGLITNDQLAIAKISTENLGLDLGSVLIKKGFVNEKQLLAFLAHHLEVPFISLSEASIDLELLRRIPLHLARQHKALPIGYRDGKILLAMVNPFNSMAKDDLADHLKEEVSPCLVSLAEMDELIQEYFQGGRKEEEKFLSIEIATPHDEESITERKKMEEMASGPKIVTAVNQIIAKANAERASDIHIEPYRNKLQIRYRVDGLLQEGGVLNKSLHMPLVSRIKILAGMDIAERRVPQDGRIRILLIGKPVDLRISTCPTQHGEKIVIRLLSKDSVKSIESLGLNKKERRLFAGIISKTHGIFLSTGPTGSGKSTTLYAALHRLNSAEKNIISIEDPIENDIEGVNQVSINSKAGLNFASVLRSVLRQDPDVIMVGEIRDAETAQIAVRAAITGHMVLSTLHTNTAVGAIARLLDLGVESFLLASALKGVMAQRLVRRICSECRVEVENRGKFSQRITQAYQGKGCERCHYTGYSGRVGIFELVPITEKIIKLIHDEAKESEMEQALREMGIKSIIEYGLEKVQAGVTTLEEVLRVTQEEG